MASGQAQDSLNLFLSFSFLEDWLYNQDTNLKGEGCGLQEEITILFVVLTKVIIAALGKRRCLKKYVLCIYQTSE